MHMRLVAVGDRQPAWVAAACAEYGGRLPRAWKFTVTEIATSRRRRQREAARARDEEGERILAALGDGERVVVLDERGTELSSGELAEALGGWQIDGRDVAFVIGGPDGLSEACLARADYRWSLSRLTLPHGLARVLCVEQLYRAASQLGGHPYHRA